MPNQIPSEDQSGETEGTRKPTDNSRSDNLGNEKQPKGRAKKRRRKRHISGNAFRWITLLIEFLALVAVSTYSWFAFQQWRTMNAQLRTARNDQRAWLAKDVITGKAVHGNPYDIAISYKNTGKTFAKNTVVVSAWKAKQLSDPDPDFDLMIATGLTSTNSSGLVPPNGTFEQHHTIREDNTNGFDDPTTVVLVFGKIWYSDIFKCAHWTTFCYRAHPAQGTYETYSAYNDADENYCD